MSVTAWLAWQDGRPDEVLAIAAEIEALDLANAGSAGMQRWIYLFPLLAVRLQAGEVDEAAEAARQIIDPAQQLLSDDLMTALTAACHAQDRGNVTETTERLMEALALARARAYF
jgi:hypothetical protein